MRYVVDIDGTICEHRSNPNFGKGKVFHNRIAKMNALFDHGHEVIYYTARGMGEFDQDVAKANEKWYNYTHIQLMSWGCRFTQLIVGKYSGDVYIDDKGIHSNDFFTHS